MSISTKASHAVLSLTATRHPVLYAAWMLLPGLVIGGAASRNLRRKHRPRTFVTIALLFPLMMLLFSCGGGNKVTMSNNTLSSSPLIYQITVSGTSPGTPPDAGQSVVVTLVVN
jgi:hypothetical protein